MKYELNRESDGCKGTLNNIAGRTWLIVSATLSSELSAFLTPASFTFSKMDDAGVIPLLSRQQEQYDVQCSNPRSESAS